MKRSLLFCMALVLLLLLLYGCSSDSIETDKYGNSKFMAIHCAEDYVKDNLKSPSSAKFSDEKAVLDGNVWTVTGKVEAQNGFGVMIQSSFSVKVKFTSSQDYTVSGSIY